MVYYIVCNILDFGEGEGCAACVLCVGGSLCFDAKCERISSPCKAERESDFQCHIYSLF